MPDGAASFKPTNPLRLEVLEEREVPAWKWNRPADSAGRLL